MATRPLRQTSQTSRGHAAGPALEPPHARRVPLRLHLLRTLLFRDPHRRRADSVPELFVSQPRNRVADAPDHVLACDAPVPRHLAAGLRRQQRRHDVPLGPDRLAADLLGSRRGDLVQLEPGREHYIALHKWFRLFVRFGLAAQMFYYGLAKVIPTQFPAAVARHAGRTGRQPVADRPAVDVHRRVHGVSNLHRLRGGARGDPAGRPADHDAGRADLPGRHDPGLRAQHDLRLRSQADLLPPDPDVADPPGAGFPASRPTSSSWTARRALPLTRRCSAPVARTAWRSPCRSCSRST